MTRAELIHELVNHAGVARAFEDLVVAELKRPGGPRAEDLEELLADLDVAVQSWLRVKRLLKDLGQAP